MCVIIKLGVEINEPKDITSDMPKDTVFYKVEAGEELKKKYDVVELPSLLIFKNRKYLGKIEGVLLNRSKRRVV